MADDIYDIARIKDVLAYRYPMLLVDRVRKNDDDSFTGMKNLTINEEFFVGHFPNHPIFPGVLQVEAMQQVGEIATREKLDPAGDGDIYIKSLSKVKFRRPNNPGDRMRIDLQVNSIKNDEADLKASISNNSGVTCQANMVLSVRPKQGPTNMPDMFTEYDKNENVKMDIAKIMELIPHRYPFLLVDYLISAEAAHVVAVKNVTYNEPFFHGYSPNYAVLPGAIQSEIIAQAGCAYMLCRPENQGKLAYFMSIEEAEFHKPVFPGDQLIIEVDIPEGHSRFGRGQGLLRVGDVVVSETTMKFAFVSP